MAHECENCGQWCYCDMDDTALNAPVDCQCECYSEPDDPYEDENDFYEAEIRYREAQWGISP